mmetsp:Transcript_94802/g.268374  ORF Transcript_94802/g.268374 Transcript_94802/m.268374 type:complete len:694 (-) Transcript_94802:312-2393(-)
MAAALLPGLLPPSLLLVLLLAHEAAAEAGLRSPRRLDDQCSISGDDCRRTQCCIEPGMACYEKNDHWASCRRECRPGSRHENDPPEHHTPWTCRPLGAADPPTARTTTKAAPGTTSTRAPPTTSSKQGGDSSLADRGFDREVSVGPDVKLHFRTYASEDIRLAIDVPGTGWAALAVGSTMSDADAVIGGGLKGGGQASDVRAYRLTSASAGGVAENPGATARLSDVEVLHENGRTKVLFARPLDNGVKAVAFGGTVDFLWAYGPGHAVGYHARRQAFSVDLPAADAVTTPDAATTVATSSSSTTATTTTGPVTTVRPNGPPSLLDRGFTTEVVVGPDVKLHYAKGSSDDIRFAIDVPGTGWAALAVGSTMADAEAVIGGGLKGGGQAGDVRAYRLTSTSGAGVVEDPTATAALSDVEVLHENGRTAVLFTRPLSMGSKPITFDGTTSFLWAYGSGSSINYHAGDRRAVRINLAAAVAEEDTTLRAHKELHGFLMIASWGVLIPMGTLAAAWGGPHFKVGGVALFNVHRAYHSLGLLLGLAGAAYAWQRLHTGGLSQLPNHGIVGLAITAQGILQPLNALLRPGGHGAARAAWAAVHRNLGRALTVAGMLNCMLGAALARQQHEGETIFDLFMLVSFAAAALFAVGYPLGRLWACARMGRLCCTEAGAGTACPPKLQPAPSPGARPAAPDELVL